MIRNSKRLLTSNTKLMKGDRYLVRGLALAPGDRSGHEVCAHRGACFEVCNLWFAGHTVTSTVRQAMADRAADLFADRAAFVKDLVEDIERLGRAARRRGVRALCRLNVASDLNWRGIASEVLRSCHTHGVTPYDYTKDLRRWIRQDPDYPLTLSWNENSPKNLTAIIEGMRRGLRIAIVTDVPYDRRDFRRHPVPPRWCLGGEWWPTVDGDVNDYRIPEEDRAPIVLLRGKGGRAVVRRGVSSGFIETVYGATY